MSHPERSAPELSLVVPFYEEADNVDRFFERTLGVLTGLGVDFEIVAVNDGSGDDTLEALLRWRARDGRIVVADLARNFGKEAALTAGLDLARGRAVALLDADLQHPPERLGPMLEAWRQGWEVVYGRREHRGDEGALRGWLARSYYRLMRALSEVEIPDDAGDFRLMDRRVVEAIRRLPERTRFMKGIYAWVGFRTTSVPFETDRRASGRSKWSSWRLWRFALDGITAFSSKPLKVWTYLGALIALTAFAYAVYLMGRTLVLGRDVPGFASLMVSILFLGGLQLVGIGFLGEYLARVFEETKGRPIYVLRALHDGGGGVDAGPDSGTAEDHR